MCIVKRDHDTALRACATALELNPNLALAEGLLAVAYGQLGDAENAVYHADNADRQSPRDPVRAFWTLARCWAALIEGDYSKGAEWAKWITDAAPHFPAGWRHLAAYSGLLGRRQDAANAVVELQRRVPDVSVRSSREYLPTSNPELLERFIDGLRKAGLPE